MESQTNTMKQQSLLWKQKLLIAENRRTKAVKFAQLLKHTRKNPVEAYNNKGYNCICTPGTFALPKF